MFSWWLINRSQNSLITDTVIDVSICLLIFDEVEWRHPPFTPLISSMFKIYIPISIYSRKSIFMKREVRISIKCMLRWCSKLPLHCCWRYTYIIYSIFDILNHTSLFSFEDDIYLLALFFYLRLTTSDDMYDELIFVTLIFQKLI